MSSSRNKCREASHAGSWYTNDGRALDSQLSQWLSDVKIGAGGCTAKAIIAPHAGFSYSGPTAAYAYNQIDASKVSRVFILGPSHHVYLKGCALTATTHYQTPLHDLIIDRAVTDELHATGHFEWMSLKTDEDEHSIEMHLPYIAKVMSSKVGQYTVVPVLVGSLSKEKEIFYGELFAKYFSDPSNLFVISSDFCHWGRRFSYSSFDEKHGTISQHIEHLDRTGMQLIESLDSEGFHSYLQSSKNTICGRHPISVLLRIVDCLRRGGTSSTHMQFKFLHYAQSGKCASKNDSSVSYAAGALLIS